MTGSGCCCAPTGSSVTCRHAPGGARRWPSSRRCSVTSRAGAGPRCAWRCRCWARPSAAGRWCSSSRTSSTRLRAPAPDRGAPARPRRALDPDEAEVGCPGSGGWRGRTPRPGVGGAGHGRSVRATRLRGGRPRADGGAAGPVPPRRRRAGSPVLPASPATARCSSSSRATAASRAACGCSVARDRTPILAQRGNDRYHAEQHSEKRVREPHAGGPLNAPPQPAVRLDIAIMPKSNLPSRRPVSRLHFAVCRRGAAPSALRVWSADAGSGPNNRITFGYIGVGSRGGTC